MSNLFFSTVQKDTKTVKMMYQKNKFPYGYIADLKCRVLELPYQGKELSMVILLPDDIEDESTGLRKVTAPTLNAPCFLLIYPFLVGTCFVFTDITQLFFPILCHSFVS